ncbi:MAG TPA: cytochrome c [Gemmataceae bacterium]|nr:cytochrome c [Gemmataceae bacterium]
MTKKLLAILVLCLAGCQQEMARQPAYRPLQPSTLFPDGLSARPLVPGTIHRDYQAVSGKKPVEIIGWEKAAALVGKLPADPLGAASVASIELSIYVDTFPAPITEKMLHRGQERYNIYCAMCHDRVGNGKGVVVQRGFTAPPNLHTDLSRGFKLRGIDVKLTKAPVGYYFEVITHGFGAMPDYASQVPPDDRWAIIAYVRALQLSQSANLADVANEPEKQRLQKSRGKQP